MRLITTTLLAAFIALFPIKAQAYAGMLPTGREAICDKPEALHQALALQGLFLFVYGMTNDPFLISVYSGNGFVVVAETPDIACVLTDGEAFYETKGGRI